MLEVVSVYLGAFAWLAAYSTIGSVVGLVVWKVFEPRRDFTHSPGPILSLLFWPIALPILLPFFIFKTVRILPDLRFPKIKLPKLPSRKKNNRESPTKILGHLVAMRVAQEPYNIKSSAFTSQDDRIGEEPRHVDAGGHPDRLYLQRPAGRFSRHDGEAPNQGRDLFRVSFVV